jgi:hypothetical protein
VFSLSFGESCSLFKMCMQISMYLFRWLLHIGLRQLSSVSSTSMKGLFSHHFVKSKACLQHKQSHWIKLAPSSIGISFLTTTFGLELAYSHFVALRLNVALISINPLFLLISLCFKKVLGISSFYYEFSWRSALGGVC